MLQNQKILFQDLLTKLTKHSGFPINNKVEIKSIEYNTFWELLNEADNASLFIVELMKLIDQSEYNKKVKNYNLENLLSTLLSISIFKNVDNVKKQREFKDAKSNLEHHLLTSTKKQQMTNPYSISIVQNLHFLFESQQQEENNFISFLIGAIAFLPDVKVAKPENIELAYDFLKQHYSLVESYGKTVRDKSDQFYDVLLDEKFSLQETGEFQFCYEYLMKQIRTKYKNNPSRVFYDSLLKYFKMIPFIAQDFPEQAEKSALSLLHITKQLITYYSSDSVDLIKSLLNQIEIFRRWPYPVGVMSNELVQILHQECKSRGNAFRMKLREEIPQIDQLDNDNSYDNSQQSQEQMIPIQQNKQDQQILSVYLFQEFKQSEASNVIQYAQNVIRYKNPNYQTVYSSHALRCYICAQILQLQNKQKTYDKNIPLTALNEQQVFNLYCKLLTIVEKCDQLDSISDIEYIYDNAFEEIYKEILKIKAEQQILQKEIQNIIRDNHLSIPDFPIFYFHNVPQRPFQFVAPKQSILRTEQQFAGPQQIIKEFINNAYINYSPLYTEPLRLLVLGGDIELNQICMLLGEIYDQDPFLLRALDIRVFLLPTQDCALAKFIAIKDPWYQRYLYIPFMEDILIPKLEHIKEDTSKPPSEFINVQGYLPLEQKAWSLNTYLREASRAYNVRVYKMKIWQKNLSQGGIAMTQQHHGLNPTPVMDGLIKSTLYFCSYVQFGAIAEFEAMKEKTKEEKVQKMTFYDYKEKNLCKFTFLQINMQTESTDMLGNMTSNITKDEKIPIQLHFGKINNVYTDLFEGNMPMPHTDWLELSYISYENSKLFDNGIRQKKIFKKHNQESIQNAFKSLFTNLSITKLNIEESNRKPFTVVVDGNIYSDIVQFKISSTHMSKDRINKIKSKKDNPCDLSSIKNLNLPVMSFLPFKV